MSDTTREVLARSLARSRRGVTARMNDNDLRQADALLAEFLVVPRSDIVGTEYGISQYHHDRAGWHVERASSKDSAITAAKREHYDDDFEGRPRTRPVERPVLPPLAWSPIPLPEGGDSE